MANSRRLRESKNVTAKLFIPRGLRASRATVGGEEFAVFSFPVSVGKLPDSLTEAERAVGLALFAGKSNAEIAVGRGTSVRTVANQISAVLRKLNVRSRAEAGAALCRTPKKRAV